jgi:uncharacterized protein
VYEWDPNKADANAAKHGVDFESATAFDWSVAMESRDKRQPYPEVRSTAVSMLGERPHVMVFTRRGQKIRVISLRRANEREARTYAKFIG